MLGREDKEPKEHIFVEGKENQDRNCGWKGSGGGGGSAANASGWKQRGKKII